MSRTVATLVRRLPHFNGDAALYKLSYPMHATRYDNDGDETTREVVYVVASAITLTGGHVATETYLFESDESGEIVDWLELPGSTKGTLSHTEALANAGYSIESR